LVDIAIYAQLQYDPGASLIEGVTGRECTFIFNDVRLRRSSPEDRLGMVTAVKDEPEQYGLPSYWGEILSLMLIDDPNEGLLGKYLDSGQMRYVLTNLRNPNPEGLPGAGNVPPTAEEQVGAEPLYPDQIESESNTSNMRAQLAEPFAGPCPPQNAEQFAQLCITIHNRIQGGLDEYIECMQQGGGLVSGWTFAEVGRWLERRRLEPRHVYHYYIGDSWLAENGINVSE
jgi:hypothetical protein